MIPDTSIEARSIKVRPAGIAVFAAPSAGKRGGRQAARTQLLLQGPLVATLLRLAAPNMIVIVAQAGLNVMEAYFVSGLGTDAIAGISLAFPVIMLMQMMSAGAMGGGISSAIARALGAGRTQDAEALVLHALVIAGVIGVLFTLGVLIGGRVLYAALGGTGAALDAAVAYSDVVFAGAVVLWVLNSMASILRGTGNMAVPAAVIVLGTVLMIPLSPALIYGWGPFPALGLRGAGLSVLLYYLLGSAVLIIYLRFWDRVVGLHILRIRLRTALFADILRVGALAAINTVQANLAVVIVTGLVGTSGTAALAGYGLGARLEYLMIPLVFGFGSVLVPLVGTNIGAGALGRAVRAAWIGAGIAGLATEAIGLAAAGFPDLWLGLFSEDAAVLEAGRTYLRIVGPFYGCLGLGMALYFASQGAGRMIWPVTAGLVRLLVAAGGGWLALRWGGGLGGIFAALSLGLVAFGSINVVALLGGAWRRRDRKS